MTLSDDVLAEIRKCYGDRVPITRKIALINDGVPMVAGLEQEEWVLSTVRSSYWTALRSPVD